MRIFVVIISGFIFYSYCLTQSYFNSLDTPVDARSIAMGESFVATPNSSSSSFYNPATLAESDGITTSFNKRFADWNRWAQNMYYLSWNAAMRTSIGSFSLFYNRFNYGEDEVYDEYNTYVGQEVAHDHTYGISYAEKISSVFDAGITLKTYNYAITYSDLAVGHNRSFKTSQPYLIDLGLLYHRPGFGSGNLIEDNISGGITFQNFGTDYTINDQYQKIPRYARVGFAYTLMVRNENIDRLQPFRFVLTGQYCNHLNAWKTMRDRRDYWNAGMEATIYEILSLKMGGIIQPFTNIYGSEKVPSYRYGFGLNIPLRKLLRSKPPFSISCDFGAIPLNIPDVYLPWWEDIYERLSAFTVELKYEHTIFNRN